MRAIAKRIEADERSVAKTISDLAERGWVAPCRSIALQFVDRRRTYYELAEPLAQIAFQLKHTRGGQPLPVVVDFLKSWFTTPDLEQADQTNAYILAAIEPAPQIVRRLHRLPANRLPAVQLWTKIDDALAALAASQPEPLFDLPAPVRSAVEARLSHRLTPLCIAQCRLDVHREVGNDYDDNSHLDLQDWIGRAETLAAEIGATQPEAFANLARWHTRAWQFAAAAEVIAQLRDRFGPDHPLTLACRNGLAHAHLKAGTLDQAIFIFEQNLTDSHRILGPDHPNTLTARNNLASAYQAVGDLGRAIPLHEEALTDSRRVLGPDHPNTLAFRDNLAFAYRAAGDLAHTSPPQSTSAPLSARPPSGCGPSDSP